MTKKLYGYSLGFILIALAAPFIQATEIQVSRELTTSYIDTTEYFKQAREFLAAFPTKSENKFVVREQPIKWDCAELLTDTANFTAEERAFLKEQNENPKISSWTTELFPKAKFISSNDLKSIFSDAKKSWTYFRKKYGNSYYSYSSPIFLETIPIVLFMWVVVVAACVGVVEFRFLKSRMVNG